MSERFADGLASSSALRSAEAAAQDARCSGAVGWLAAWASAEAAGIDPEAAAAWAPTWAADAAGEAAARNALAADEAAPVNEIASAEWRRQRQLQCSLLRDIMPNPFQQDRRIDPSCLQWKNRIVVKAAQAYYDLGAGIDLTPIAQLLEQAGCKDEMILTHCRDSSGHVRGCWVLDLLLGNRKPLQPEKKIFRFQWSHVKRVHQPTGRVPLTGRNAPSARLVRA